MTTTYLPALLMKILFTKSAITPECHNILGWNRKPYFNYCLWSSKTTFNFKVSSIPVFSILSKRVKIGPKLAKYSWQTERFKYQTTEIIKRCPYPCISSVPQLTALRLNLFCFLICFYFVWPNFSNLLELTFFWAPNKNYATIFKFYLHSHFLLSSAKL